MRGSVDGRIVLVTGGTGALGRAIVRRFVADGARVHSTWFHQREADELREVMGDSANEVHLHQADVTSERAVHQLFGAIDALGEPVEVLANIVGGFLFASVDETDGETWNRMMAMNATSAFLCCRAAVPRMRKNRWGRIVNVASVPGFGRGAANMSAYAASKAAVMNLTQSLSEELVRDGISVNALVPTVIDTLANRQAMPEADTSTWLQPEAIADVVAFLATEEAGIVTGTAINLSKG